MQEFIVAEDNTKKKKLSRTCLLRKCRRTYTEMKEIEMYSIESIRNDHNLRLALLN